MKIAWGIIILMYVFSVAICSANFSHAVGHAAKDTLPDIHCGIELKSYIPPEDGVSSLFELTLYRKLLPLIVEPRLPILVYSILKIPKSI